MPNKRRQRQNAKRNRNNAQPKRVGRARRRRRNGNGLSNTGRGPAGDNINTFLPTSVNNKATMPRRMQDYMPVGCEAISTITVSPNTPPGSVVFNQQISHEIVARLKALSMAFQRVTWRKCVLKLVTLNGSLVSSGYTAGFIEDPEVVMPTDPKQTVQFLTSLRGSSIRQNWVSSTVGQIVTISDLPEMYTTRGVDPRRFYIGRYVVVLNGSPETANTTFQVMLEYDVDFKVPIAKPVVDSSTTFTFPSPVLPGMIGFSGALTAPIGPTEMAYEGPMPPPGIYSVPNAMMTLKSGAVTFGWNEKSESNPCDYKDWPDDLIAKSGVEALRYLVVPNGAQSINDCGYRQTLTGNTIMFSSLATTVAAVTTSVTGDGDYSGIDLSIPAPTSWLPAAIPFASVVKPAATTFIMPTNFPELPYVNNAPIINSGTVITYIGPPPSSLEIELQQLKHIVNSISLSD